MTVTVSTLTELYTQTLTSWEQARQRQAEKQAAEKAALEARAIELLNQDLNRWPLLRKLLALQGKPAIHGKQAIIQGQTQINDLPVTFTARIEVPLYTAARPYTVLECRGREDRAIVECFKLTDMEARHYADYVAGLCIRWMEAHAQAEIDREEKARAYGAQLAIARQVHEAAQLYEQAYSDYLTQSDTWARSEAQRLWEPHTLWRVRYPALVAEPIDETSEAYLATAVCLEMPDDIVTELHRATTATITVVDPQGNVVERQIVALLDAEPMAQVAHSFHEPMPYHRCYKAVRAGVMVNVPAHELTQPSRPPEFPSWATFLTVHAPDLDERWEEEDPAFLLGLEPEQIVEWGWELNQ